MCTGGTVQSTHTIWLSNGEGCMRELELMEFEGFSHFLPESLVHQSLLQLQWREDAVDLSKCPERGRKEYAPF